MALPGAVPQEAARSQQPTCAGYDHGLLNPKGPEPGDIPNIFVGLDGIGEMEAFNPRVSLVEGPNNLLDADGSTLVIHERADNHVTQPIGGAGGRIA